MKKIFLIIIMSMAAAGVMAQKKNNSRPLLKNEIDSVSYALGASMASFYKQQGIKNVNLDLAMRAMNDVLKHDTSLLNDQQVNMTITNFLQRLKSEKLAANKQAGEKFLAENKTKPGVVTTASGLQYIVIVQGTGPKPAATDRVKCHYHGTLLNGIVFDSSVERGQPSSFSLKEVITGWTEALQLMPVGSKWRLFVPAHLAYGDRERGPKLPAGSTLIFDVELLDILK